MEERSSKRPQPSGDWKPYERDKEQTAREQPSGDWKPYKHDERDEPADSEAQAPPSEAQKVEAKQKQEAARDGQQTEAEDRNEQDSEHSKHEPSTVDAMGKEKHREVIGQRYGASRGRQLLYYGIFVAVVIGAYIGLKAGADSLDKAPAKDTDQAPWSKPEAPGEPLGGFQPDSPGRKGATDFQ